MANHNPLPSEKHLVTILNEITKRCKENANSEIVNKYAYYFKEGYDAFGLEKETYVTIQKELFEKYVSQMDVNHLIRLGDRLVIEPKFEYTSLIISWLVLKKKELAPSHFVSITNWLDDGIRNWAHCDYLCGDLLSLFFMAGYVTPNENAHWKTADSRWKRRALPVSLITYFKKKSVTKTSAPFIQKYNVSSLLPYVEPLMLDQERVVHQGVGWFLREAWKIDPAPVEKLLLKYKDSSARLIIQYATERMTKEQKERFRKSK